MTQTPIYTIGYGGRSIEELIALLHHYEIEYLIDVRSQPYSRYTPQFSKDTLEKYLIQHNVRYVFMGDTLGGRPGDETCYVDGKVDYAKVSAKAFYQQGISRLRTAWEKQLHIAIMCAEAKSQECHRSKLIGNTLIEQHIGVAHIDESGEIKKQEEINRMLMGNHLADQLSLFDESPMTLNAKVGHSKKKYSLQSEKA